MDVQYWDNVAGAYEESILNSLTADHQGVVIRQIDRCKSRRAVAVDFGCGVGNYLPALARRFKHVHAMDHSAKCLDAAKAACRPFKNITYRRADLTRARRPSIRADFGVCANVLLMQKACARAAILKNIRRGLRAGAALLLIVPAVESALLTHHRRQEWMRRSAGRRSRPLAGSFVFARESGRSVADGLLTITDVPTKHFLREELEMVLAEHRFKVLELRKVEYGWATEFESPPRWMRAPYPWDWLAVCRA